MFEPNRTDWSAGKVLFGATGSRSTHRRASSAGKEIAEFAGCSFFLSFVQNQNQSTIFQTNNILTHKSHDTSTN